MPIVETSPLTRPAVPDPNHASDQKRHRWLRTLILLLIVAGIAAAIWRIATARAEKDKQVAAQAALFAEYMKIPVEVADVRQHDVPVYLDGLGTVTAYYTVTVNSRVSGQIVQVNFKEGQNVRKGDLLIVIDPAPYKAALDQAKGQLERDQAQLDDYKVELGRYKSLYQQGVFSKEQLDAEQALYGQYLGTVQTDKAAIETAQVNLNYCYIKSPIDGRVGLRLVDPGNIVQSTTTTGMLIITQMRPIAVDFTLPEEDLPQVLPRMRSKEGLTVDAFDQTFTTHLATGKLLTVSNQIDQTTGTAEFKAIFANADETLFPNEFVNVRLVLRQLPKAIVMPAAALQHGPNGDFVFVVQPDQTVKMQPVHVALTEKSMLVVDKGVSAGQQVVIDGAEKLKDGSKISATVANDAAAYKMPAQGMTL
ncbi:MAG TPA: efflux RND transporter periplasmic adaptor subunit [Acidobacteriaceae bacterium]|nr:efflux RND transporter periplasmic adaptor subunit [Acidobacteriaceae bacterium]